MSIDFPYSVEPAKTNRASCKVCKQKIDKDALRIGTETMGAGDYTMTSWRAARNLSARNSSAQLL